MVFKVCDAEKDPLSQGFVEGSYDVIIASLVVHATAELDRTMGNLRKLLKPGGFLVIGEGSSDGPLQSGDGFIFGALPGWWLGVEEGRNLSPFVNVPQWDVILKRTGFSGIDTMSPPQFLETFGVILFVSQAVDDRIKFIREPTSSPTGANIDKLVIVGGQTKAVADIVRGIEDIFRELGSRVVVYPTLEEVDHTTIDSEWSVISLSELDQPAFKNITPERWYGFRKMFEVERTVLWLTSGRIEDEPFSNIIIGFGRSAVHELDDLRLQFLDIPDPKKIASRSVAETLIRFHQKDLESDDILYTAEPEIVVDTEGQQLVPRLQPISEANDRYNSIQRPITHDISASSARIELRNDGNSYNLREQSRYETRNDLGAPDLIEIDTTHTTCFAIKTTVGHKYLALGKDSKGSHYLTFNASPTSSLKLPRGLAVPCDLSGFGEDAFLAMVAAYVTATAVIAPMVAGQRVVVHNAPSTIAQAITAQAKANKIETTFTLDATETVVPPSTWNVLPLYLGDSDLSEIIPADTACFLGLSNDSSVNETTILASLSPYCRKETADTIYAPTGIHSGSSSAFILRQNLETAIAYVQGSKGTREARSPNTVKVESLVKGEHLTDPTTIVKWEASNTLPVQVTRFDIKPLFKEDKTYWLCGMSGALGISLCDWMIDRGVRYLVLTSRNPKVEPAWIEDHRRNGAIVKTISWYVPQQGHL